MISGRQRKMQKNMIKKGLIVVISILFFGASIVQSIAGFDKDVDKIDYMLNENETLNMENDDYDDLMKQVIENGVMSNDDWFEQDKLLASDGAPSDYFGLSVSIDGDYAIIGAYHSNTGSAYIFKRTGKTWTEEQKLTASDGTADDQFGYSVSIDGNYVIIGANGDDSSTGSAYVFKRTGTSWAEEQKLTASDGANYDYFGVSVSIDEDYAIIGAYRDDNSNGNDAGSAYIFKRTGTSWAEEQKLTASDGTADDSFGLTVSIEGNYAIVGAYHDDTLTGSAYVFKRSDSSWIQEDKLTASDGATGDQFGSSVSINGDYVIIGAYGDDSNGIDAGSAYIFKRTGTNWNEEDKLLASDSSSQDKFGISVSINGDYVIIGAYGDGDNGGHAGSAYIFKYTGTTWTQHNKLLASDGAPSDYFGRPVSIDGDYAIIGAYGNDDNGDESGSAYIFKKAAPDLDCIGSLSWTDIKPGEIVIGEFMIANIGDPGTELSWEIGSCPSWGTWTFLPPSGTGLTPGMGAITLAVEVVAPDQQNMEFTGEVSVVNSEDNSDYDTIPVSLITSKNKTFKINLVFLRFRDQNLNNIPIVRHLMGPLSSTSSLLLSIDT